MDETEARENARIIWGDVQELARTYDKDPSLQAWVGRLMPVSLDGGTFTAAAKLKWTEQKIMTSYKKILEDFIYEITLEHISLNVIVNPSYFDESTGDGASQVAAQTTPAPPTQAAPTPAPPAHETAPQPTGRPTGQESRPLAQEEPSREDAAAGEDTRAKEEDAPQTDVTREGASVTLGGESPAPTRSTTASGAPLESLTFDTFVVGEANRMAFEVARAVAEGSGLPGNQIIFFYSKPGLGKTHLMLAIYNYLNMYRANEVNAVFATANGFAEDYIDEIKNKRYTGKDVMKKYRDCDVLLVDDVQYLEHKQETAITFFDIFNSLTLGGKTIVLSADEPPDYLELDQRMKTRFNMGTVISIAQPSFELKRQILQSHYDRRRAQVSWLSMDLTSEQLDLIAQLSPNNIRDMQGFLSRVLMEASMHPSEPLDADQIRAIHDEMFRVERQVEIPTIIKVVAKEYGVSEQDLRGQRRTKTVSEARQVSMWLARQMTDDSFSAIGSHFNRDHSTVYNSVSKIDTMSQKDRSFMKRLQSLEKTIRNR